ncbi:hypothetical protein CGLO_14587 [Colletotrichum gloeosporioides Cg-14]|nr:hypothetical protein CGLO_14587 [Colletotrichum gloeosporioides Cg-14]
MSIKCY